MKSITFNKTIAVFLIFIFIFGLFPSMVLAQPNSPLTGEIRGFNRSVFESHFSKADREINPERWLFEARLGITQAIYAWELIACGLYENPLFFQDAKSAVEKWSNEELETRFSQWLIGRFFGEAVEKAIMDFSAMFGETQKNYSWHLDDEGNIIFDDKTGDPLVIRPGDEREFSSDLSLWRTEAEDHVNKMNTSFDAVIAGLYAELLAYIPEELRETMSAVIRETGGNITGTIKREFENIAAREERIFTSRRTRDIWSLRKKSDDEAARIFTQRLISETEEICARGIEALTIRIEEASAGTGDLAILGEEWLRLYKEQFDRGLKAWEEAEERFFIRRIEWEQESFRLFSEGEQIWLAAFNQFEEERRKWELKARELFQAGETMFKNISEDFERSIAEARKEFELNMTMRIGEGTAKVKALIDMYLICASAAVSAMENVQFWHSQYNSSNKKDIKDPDFYSWLVQEQRRTNNSLLTEIIKSYELYASYMEKAMDARDRILADYAGLFGTGALKDILSPNASSEDFYLDEYQIALVRAKALVLYWERKTAIAEAVLAYAGELSAGRMTEAEGIRAWEEAKAAYNNSLAVYETELNKLTAIGEDIGKQQEILHDLAQKLLREEEELNRLNSEYSILVSASIINRGDFYLLDLNAKYDYLVKEYILFLQSGNNAVYKNILEYGMKRDIAEYSETAGNVLNILINGYGVQISSLAELEKDVLEGNAPELSLKIRLAGIDLFADNNSGQLRPFDSAYSGADWYSKAKGLNLTQEEKNALYGEKLNAQLIADYKNSARILLEKRIELELNSLKNIIDTEPDNSYEYILPEFCLINSEIAAYVYEILLRLKERIDMGEKLFTENNEENEIINFFLSGGSFFTDSAQYLAEYYNEYNFNLSLLELYSKYAAISSFTRKELWQDTCNSLVALFADYGFNQPRGSLPDIQKICGMIYGKPGDFMQNTAQFLLEFDKCFQLIPQWLEHEINNWKRALIEYAASFAFYTDSQHGNLTEVLSRKKTDIEIKYNELLEYADSLRYAEENEVEKINDDFAKLNDDIILHYYTEQIFQEWETIKNAAAAGNEKHWRQFLTDDYLTNNDTSLAAAYSWKEGVLADSLYNASYFTNRVNDSFLVFQQKDFGYSGGDTAYFHELYLSEVSEIFNRFNIIKLLYNEIANAGKAYDFSSMIPDDIKTQLDISYAALKVQEEKYNSSKNEYLREAEKFLNIGTLYDEQYNKLKKAHDNTDQKRFEYEKQDAIQRWASTAYLNTDHIDLENCRTKLSKAQTVLDVLSDIYSGENRRPYDNPEYDKLYAEYEQSFSRKLKILEAIEVLTAVIAQEYASNERIFSEYQKALHQLGYVDQNYSNYISPDQRFSWTVKDIITVRNGRLAFSTDTFMRLSGVDEKKAEELNHFFNTTILPDNERFNISCFDEALRGLSQRMSGYFANAGKFRQWSLARDYLLTSLINNNPDLFFLHNYYSGLGQMESYGSLGSLMVKDGVFKKLKDLYSASEVGAFDRLHSGYLFSAHWQALNAEEKADLEFYVILTLMGIGSEYFTGFSQVYTLDVYNIAYDYVYDNYSHAKKQKDTWWKTPWSWTYNGMKDYNYNALKRIEPVLFRTKNNINNWTIGLQRNLSSIEKYSLIYAESCEKIKTLEGEKNGLNVDWDDIYSALIKTGRINETDIAALKTYWEKMLAETGMSFANVSNALTGLLFWAKNTEEKSKTALETRWSDDRQNQQKNEIDFQTAAEAYIAGNINIEILKTAAENAYGKDAASWKNHYINIYDVLLNDLSMYTEVKFNFFSEFSTVGSEITALTTRALKNKYDAEFAVREFEWDQQLRDISEKYKEWLDSAALIFENGRMDWGTSIKKMEEAYKQWHINFQNEYNRVSDEWAIAYLAGLEDKEKWLGQAAAAANEASAESFLMLAGTEGERLSRFIDTREPFGIRNAVPETETLIAELLMSSGINNMHNAFGSINNIAGISSPLVKRGLAGLTWDSALAKTAATDLARKTNNEIAERESRKLAFYARLAADEAIKNLAANVDLANQNFQNNMDNMFIFDGVWRKTGNNYVKDIVKGSSVFTPVISETITITGYANYRMKPVSLQTNIDENYLAGLDTIAIRGLIENVYIEIGVIAAEIFGIGGDIKIINTAYLERREQSPGKFGAHIGYEPAVRDVYASTIDSIFYDRGAGELGRLLTEFNYWRIIDSRGSAELALAPWDKRLWNDENSFFSAPTLRFVGQIAGSVAAGIFTGGLGGVAGIAAIIGINSASDVLFGSFDLAFGYKTFDEVAFNVGKSILTNSVNGFTSGVFNGLGGADTILGNGFTKTAVNTASDSINQIMIQTLMTGAQTITTGFASSVIGAVTYNNTDRFGWNNEIFGSGLKGMFTNTATSITTGSLQIINSGISLEKLEGFSIMNKTDISKLNNLAGSFAGQGINYAMGNDFTLNLLNLGLLTSGKVNSGLLELHLGRNGANMNIGTGGANISFDNLIAAFRGAQVWNVNNHIGTYTDKNDFDSKIALRALFGFGDIDQKDQLWDILRDRTEIWTDTNGEFAAETNIINGKRIIQLTGYQRGMSMEDQMRLAAILGHEAYRDGYKTGEMDASGNIVTTERSSDELKEASIARLLMGDRINQDYNWFYDLNMDFAFENYLLNMAKASGDYSLFNDYLQFTYKNERDYFFQWASTGGNHQNENRFKEIPLFNAKTRDVVNELNEQGRLDAYERYKNNPLEEQRDNPVLWDEFKVNEKLLKDNGYKEVKFNSIYLVGCMFMSTKYGLEAVLGKPVDTMELHNFIVDNNYYLNESSLSKELMATIMTNFANDEFTVTLAQTGLPSLSMLYNLDQSNEMYIAHLRIKENGTGDGYHSVMISGIEYAYDNYGQILGINKIHVANSWDGNSFTGKTSYTMDQIARWDIFKITHNRP